MYEYLDNIWSELCRVLSFFFHLSLSYVSDGPSQTRFDSVLCRRQILLSQGSPCRLRAMSRENKTSIVFHATSILASQSDYTSEYLYIYSVLERSGLPLAYTTLKCYSVPCVHISACCNSSPYLGKVATGAKAGRMSCQENRSKERPD